MNLYDLLPTRKVTAFLLGGSVALAALWLLTDVFAVLEEWPDPVIIGAWTIIVGFLLAWWVPDTAWQKAATHSNE